MTALPLKPNLPQKHSACPKSPSDFNRPSFDGKPSKFSLAFGYFIHIPAGHDLGPRGRKTYPTQASPYNSVTGYRGGALRFAFASVALTVGLTAEFFTRRGESW